MSDTPRTDAATLRYRYYEKRGDWHGQDYFDYVEPESMAELERELAAANARADSARRELDAVYAWLDNNTSHYDVDADYPVEGHNIPVLAQVSNRIWYHATDDITAYPFSALIRTLINLEKENGK